MAKQIAKLLKTDVMADIDLPALAQLLQKLGRKGDKILAHITPKEAKKLKEEGGSGTINPKTGLPEFYDGEDYSAYDMAQFGTPEAPASVSVPSGYDAFQAGVQPEIMGAPSAGYAPAAFPTFAAPARSVTPVEADTAQFVFTPAAPPSVPSAMVTPTEADIAQFGREIPATEKPALEDKNFFQKYLEGLTPEQKSNLLLKGGLGVGTGLLSALQANRSAKQAQQARAETAALGQPYQQQGQEMIAQARRGELTPAGQQRLQAARAALAQGVERRGGVGAQQATAQLESLRQQLLDNQYNYGLRVAQIGDTYAQRAIQVGLTQDREMAAMMQGLTGALSGFLGAQPNQPKTGAQS